jgi:hypothetical protein
LEAVQRGADLITGFGNGTIDAGLNNYVSSYYNARQMNWLHASFGEEGYRRFLTNGILWSAKIEIPAAGAPVALTAASCAASSAVPDVPRTPRASRRHCARTRSQFQSANGHLANAVTN